MKKITHSHSLYSMINPSSITLVGASNNLRSMGSVLLMSLREAGYDGAMYPVHPKEDEVQSYRAYRSVTDLPEIPDLAVIVLPTAIVSKTLEQCGEKGIRNAIVISGGFKEVGGQGLKLEEELVATAKKWGIRIIGPNCMGVVNPHHKMNTTTLAYEGRAGFVGLVSQSGSFVAQMFDYLNQLNLGFSTAISVGNEALTDTVDWLEYLGTCPKTKVIALYIEGIKRGRAFIGMARSIVPHKPIVALYVGGSEGGRRAGLSHTGAMAGPDQLYESIFRQSGVLRADTLIEMFDFCLALGTLPLPNGNRVVVQTHSGGPGTAAADACSRAGLDFTALSDYTRSKLSELVSATASLNNPVDLTFQKNPQYYFKEIPEALIEDKNADILMIYLIMPIKEIRRRLIQGDVSEENAVKLAEEMILANAKTMADLLKRNNKPLIGYTWRNMAEEHPRALLENGVPIFQGPERAARAAAALVKYKRLREMFSARALKI
ncbi:acetate--CoA ligase family protein [Thermodesulfobacteriota bacterium]